jgi:hypothetical protein
MKLATATVIAIIDLCRARGGKFDGTIVVPVLLASTTKNGTVLSGRMLVGTCTMPS